LGLREGPSATSSFRTELLGKTLLSLLDGAPRREFVVKPEALGPVPGTRS
jgi:hypothetical protein